MSHYINPDVLWQNRGNKYHNTTTFIYDGDANRLFTTDGSDTHAQLMMSDHTYFYNICVERSTLSFSYEELEEAAEDDYHENMMLEMRSELQYKFPDRMVFGRCGLTSQGDLLVAFWEDYKEAQVEETVEWLKDSHFSMIQNESIIISRPSGLTAYKEKFKFSKDAQDKAKEAQELHMMNPVQKREKLMGMGAGEFKKEHPWKGEARKIFKQIHAPWEMGDDINRKDKPLND